MAVREPAGSQDAFDRLADAAAEVRRADAIATLAARQGLAYVAADELGAVYLVAYDGRLIGELRHDPAAGAIDEWHAVPIDADNSIGEFRTARQAAAALLALESRRE